MPTLYLIDGYAQFFRAYHAIRSPMTSPVTKEPTNMTFGFVGMLLKLLRGDSPHMRDAGGPPDYVAVAIDVSGDRGTFRSQLLPEYKATRPPPPDDIGPQIARCLGILAELGVPVIGSPGFEADDAIAAIVERLRCERPDLRIRIVSKDKDLKQLIVPPSTGCAGVELFDVHTDEAIDAARLKADTGLEPAQVIDMLALMGDSVDNVPGVEGIGPKTAAQLIGAYGSLEGLLARAAEIKGKRGENIRAAADKLPLSRRLVTLRADAPIEFDLAAADARRLHLDRLPPILRELGFNRYQEEVKALLGLPAADATAAAPAEPTTAARPRGPGPEFGGLFDAVMPPAAVMAASGEYTCVRTAAELEELVRAMQAAPRISVDTETLTLGSMTAHLAGISISLEPGGGYYIPVRSPDPDSHLDERAIVTALRPVLGDPQKAKIGHNLKYDILVLRRHGIELRGLTADGGCDTMVASYLIDPSRSSHSLDALALALLGRTNIPITDLIGAGRNQRTFDHVPLDQATCYAAEDADVTLQLADVMMPRLNALGLMDLARKVELPLVEVLAELEYNGILVDPDELDRQRERLAVQIGILARRIQDESVAAIGRGFDLDSPRQLAAVLFNKPGAGEPGLGLRPLKKTKTGNSTDAEVLEKIAADPSVATPIPSLILEYRQLTKLVNTYLVALKDAINPDTKRIHASFNQTVAATGRLSSSDPNLQNIPIRTDIGREIRRAFIAPAGRVLITADYSQIELRLLAHLARDPAMIEAFHRGEDIHASVAAEVFGVPLASVTKSQRNTAKMVNFGIVYGVTPFGLARRLGISNEEGARIIADYKRRFAGITTFLEECIAQAKRYGYVETMLKRRRPIPDVESNNPSRRALAERLAINSVVQGSAADLIKVAMVDLHRRLSEHGYAGGAAFQAARPAVPGVRMLLQIHDELVFEAPEESAEEVREIVVHRMEAAMTLAVPLKADAYIARNWYEGK